MNVGNASQNSKATTANTNEGRRSDEELVDPGSDDDDIDVNAVFPQKQFVLSEETGEKGAKPESNQILDTETTLIRSKKDKLIEVFRNSTEIRELITSSQNEQRLELGKIIDMLFSN